MVWDNTKRYTTEGCCEEVIDTIARQKGPEQLDKHPSEVRPPNEVLKAEISVNPAVPLKNFSFDSLDIIELKIALEDRFGVELPEMLKRSDDITTNDLTKFVEQALRREKRLDESGQHVRMHSFKKTGKAVWHKG